MTLEGLMEVFEVLEKRIREAIPVMVDAAVKESFAKHVEEFKRAEWRCAKAKVRRTKTVSEVLGQGILSVSDSESDSDQSKTLSSEVRDKYPPDFEAFWSAYPRKLKKGNALAAWAKHNPPLDKCLATLAWQTKDVEWTKEGGKYIPHPSSWLNGSRWDDEPMGKRPETKRNVVVVPDEIKRAYAEREAKMQALINGGGE